MSKVKITFEQAKSLAERIKTTLAPGCVRIEIAGSIRRKKATVGDIEIVCIPKYQRNLFDEIEPGLPTELDAILGELVKQGRFLNPAKNGSKFKQLGIPAISGLLLDLFITTPECWGVIMALRTGPAEFSQKLVTWRGKGGLLPDDCRVSGGRVWRGGQAIATPEEADVFELIGGWVEPQLRTS